MGTLADLIIFGGLAIFWAWLMSPDWGAAAFGAALLAIFVGYRYWTRKLREKAWRDRHTVIVEDRRRR